MADATGAQSVGGGSRLQVLGANQLQQSLDSLTSAVNSLSSKMGGSSGPIGSGASFSSAPNLNAISSGGNGGSPTVGGAPIGMGGGPPTMNQTSSGGSGSNGGWMSAAAGVAGGLSSFGSGSFGAGQLGTMASLSAMGQYMSAYGASPGRVNTQMTTLNDIASSASDLASGNALLAYSSGSWTGANSMSRQMTGAANMVGMTNPSLGWNSSVSLSQQMYSQQMAANMMMMGYGTLPRTTNGKINSSQAVMQAYMQRAFGGKSKVSQAQFNSAAAVGGKLNYNMQALYGSNAPDMLNTMSAYNKLSNAGYSNSRQASIWNGAEKHNQGDLGILTKTLGPNFTSSVLQSLKDKTAVGTQRSGEEENSYQSGLSTSVGLLNKFNQALNKILNGPLGKIVGYAGGAGAGGGGFLNAGKDLLSGNYMGALTSIVGGGAAATGASSNGKTASTAARVNTSVSGAAKGAVSAAESQMGVPYVWGAEQPGIGFDCSGLTQWAYKRAGVNIPRTSQQQWSALAKNHSVNLNSVQEGDLVFTAGSDGTPNAPGHVALMISNNKLIQAEETGTNIMLSSYDPKAWDHAARPTGPGTTGMSSSSGSPASGIGMASGGGGYSEGGAMGSTNEADAVNGTGSGGGYMSGMLGASGFTGSSGTTGAGAAAAPANATGNVALGKQLAAKRGWTGTQWNDLYALWNRESGWSNTARNGTSGAYGIAQALGHGPSNQYPAGQYLAANQPPTGSSNAREQILWGLQYIASAYGNPAKAWAHEQASSWYSRGTQNSNPGMAIVGEDGPEAVKLPGGSQVLTAGQTAGMLAQIQSGQGKSVTGGAPLVSLTFGQGAIVVNGTVGGSSSDVSSSAQEIAAQIGKYLAEEDMVQKLATGVSS